MEKRNLDVWRGPTSSMAALGIQGNRLDDGENLANRHKDRLHGPVYC
jgi:hypothetical protein